MYWNGYVLCLVLYQNCIASVVNVTPLFLSVVSGLGRVVAVTCLSRRHPGPDFGFAVDIGRRCGTLLSRKSPHQRKNISIPMIIKECSNTPKLLFAFSSCLQLIVITYYPWFCTSIGNPHFNFLYTSKRRRVTYQNRTCDKSFVYHLVTWKRGRKLKGLKGREARGPFPLPGVVSLVCTSLCLSTTKGLGSS